ncbi:alpha/beta fold hydrolase [Kitasatospora sp. NPDC058170]|uniref:alpha/beta fold hydrolase n=1 Tax=Kitasatospora sp. NPDC058170 TaxID=3346364 RepID=UPI0036DD200A
MPARGTPAVLFCIPHAGGSVTAFQAWQPLLGGDLRVRPVESAGRGTRSAERGYEGIPEAAEDLARVVAAETDGADWVLLGHSMGALIAYEAARLLQERGFPPARRLVVSACPPPQRGFGPKWDADTPDSEVEAFLLRLGSVPAEIARDRDAMAYYAGLVREDARLTDAYRYRPPREALNCPVTVLWGDADPVTAPYRAQDWQEAVGRPVEIRTATGAGHFLLTEQASRAVALLRGDLLGDPPTGNPNGNPTGNPTGTPPGGTTGKAAAVDTGTELYLDLLKKTLTNVIYEDPPLPSDWAPDSSYDPISRHAGLDWPSKAHTMVGLRRLDNVQYCVERILRDGVPGDFIETGVWRGGTSIFLRALLRAHGVTDRRVWAADSFRGMPEVGAEGHPGDAELETHLLNDVMGVPLEQVRSNFEAYGLLDDQVRFLPGWFKDTLPKAPIRSLALMRLDGDLYESTMDALTNLYPKLSVGGFVIVDDYLITVCQEAVHDFRRSHGIDDEIKDIDGYGAYWRRTR